MTERGKIHKCKFHVRLNGAAYGGHQVHINQMGTTTVITLSRAVLVERADEGDFVIPTLLDANALHLVEIGYGSLKGSTPLRGVWRYRDAKLVDSVLFDGDSLADKYMYETLVLHSNTTPIAAFHRHDYYTASTAEPIPSAPPEVMPECSMIEGINENS